MEVSIDNSHLFKKCKFFSCTKKKYACNSLGYPAEYSLERLSGLALQTETSQGPGSSGAEPGPATRQRGRAQGATAIHLRWLCALRPTDHLCGVLHLMSLH